MALPAEVVDSARVPRIGAYSRAVRVGDTVYTAGQPGIDPANERFAEFFPVAPPVGALPIVQLPRGLLFSVDAIAMAERV